MKIAFMHVATLRKNGIDAAILDVHPDPKGNFFFSSDVPVEQLSAGSRFSASDVIVIPEAWHRELQIFERLALRKIVFCQNHFNVSFGLGERRDYSSYGVQTVFCCSNVIAEFLKSTLQLTGVPIVRNGIDRSLFRPAENKHLQIAYMPRKMRQEALFLIDTFKRRSRRFASTKWISIDRKTENEVATILGESSLFLSLARMEGFGLPPLEAMATDTLVVGFTGDGGADYATRDNGLWCAAEDWSCCLTALETALTWCEAQSPELRRRLAAGRQTVSAYSLAQMEADLVAFWKEELGF